MKNNLVLLMSLFIWAGCSTNKNAEYKLGELSVEVSGSKDAMKPFMKGYLLLHSFEYQDAAEAFREAQEMDPDFAMAYWGEAMTYNHSIWQEQDLEKGRNTLLKLGSTSEARVAKAKTELERDFIKALDVLYGEGSKSDRDKAYADYMGMLHGRYPENHEVASFYALGLLGSVTVGRSDEVYQKSAGISEKILKENPNHPGALHYFIHANDDPYHAAVAVQVANEYAIVAPDAAHALHMPTHIYLALGMWDKVVSSNENSWQASINRKQRKELDNDALGYHSYHWLQYGYLQEGRIEDGQIALENMISFCKELPSARARTHEILFKSTYLVEADDWGSALASHSTDAGDLNILTRSMEAFIKGMKAYHDRDNASLKNLVSEIEKARILESAKISDGGIAICSSGGASRENATKLDIDLSQVIEMELRAMSARMEDDLVNTEKWLKEASVLEESVSYSYGPPVVAKPSFELYADFLMTLGRAEEALAQYDKSLQIAPRRLLSLRGKLNAATLLKDTELIENMKKEIQDLTKKSPQQVASFFSDPR